MKHYKNILKCRVCHSKKLTAVVKIKPQFIASTFVKSNKNNPKAKIKIPMTLMLCRKCGLVQLKETVMPDLLYENYFYRSNVSNTMNRDLRDVVANVCSNVSLKHGDSVLDIGCNDGLMLTFFPKYVKRTGIDPAKNIDWSNLDKSITIVNDYFPSPQLKNKSFKIITTTAMFYDLDDPNTAVKQIKQLLTPDGVLCIQVSYLYDTIRDMNFYDICHEHLWKSYTL
jgi:2-polyprenyl-3-methyl-5-hydroxy-6-metoxy-1,4-benzoquinol methylase